MKKYFVIIVLLTVQGALTAVAAQSLGRNFYKTPYRSRNSGAFSRHAGLLTFSYGVPNLSGTGSDYWDDDRIGFGPAYVKYEHGLLDEIGIGGYAAFAGTRYSYGNSGNRYHDKVFAFSMGALAYYHFNKLIPVRNLDVYAGVGLGGRQLTYTYDDDYKGNRDDHSKFTVFPVGKVGARYYFTHLFGVYAEAGYDKMSDVNAGITLRF